MSFSANGGKNAVQIVSFHPYLFPVGSADATRHQRVVLPSNTLVAIYSGPPNAPGTTVELRAHDEVTPGGIPVAASPGSPGGPGPIGPMPLHNWIGTALGFQSTAGGPFGPYVDLKGEKGDDGDQGEPGPIGETPVPVWNGTTLEWQDGAGNTITPPVDLRGPEGDEGPQGLNGALVWISDHPTFGGVQVIHIVPAGSPPGTVAQTYNVGMAGVDDFEYDAGNKRLRITTKSNDEFEVDLSNLVSQQELAEILAGGSGPVAFLRWGDADADSFDKDQLLLNDGLTLNRSEGSALDRHLVTRVEHAYKRKNLKLIVNSDNQAMPWDPLMPIGQEFQQIFIQRAMLDEMGDYIRSIGGVDGMIHCGDVVDRSTVRASIVADYNSLDWVAAGLPEMQRTYAAGDEMPYGYKEYLADLYERAGLPVEAIEFIRGNHDRNGSGKYTHFYAWSFDGYNRHVGNPAYIKRFGKLGFVMISDFGGGTGGQIPREVILGMRAELRANSDLQALILVTHQPLVGKGPTDNRVWLDPVTINAAQAAGLEPITIGNYALAHEEGLQVYRNPPSTVSPGVALEARVDYTWVTPAGGVVDPDIVGNGNPSVAGNPYTQILLLQPLVDGDVLRGFTYISESSQSILTSNELLLMLEEFSDKFIGHFYGHTGRITLPGTATHRPTVYDADLGLWRTCHNMAIPSLARLGIHSINQPLIYSLFEVIPDEDAGTTLVRMTRRNSTAGMPLAESHPAIASICDYEQTLPFVLDLGDENVKDNPKRDARPIRGTDNYLYVRRDVLEAQTYDPLDGWRLRPGTNSMLLLGSEGATDEAISDVPAGFRFGYSVRAGGAAGLTTPTNRLTFLDYDPSHEVERYGWEHKTGSDSAPTVAGFRALKNADGEWVDALFYDEDGLRSRVLGERFQLPAVVQNDIVLVCRADRSKDGLPGESHFRQTVVGRRANSVTTTDDSLYRAFVDHTTAADNTYRTSVLDLTTENPARHEWVYCDTPSGERWLGVRQTSTALGTVLNEAIWYLQGGHRATDEPEMLTLLPAADASNIVPIQDHPDNIGVSLWLNNTRIASANEPNPAPRLLTSADNLDTIGDGLGAFVGEFTWGSDLPQSGSPGSPDPANFVVRSFGQLWHMQRSTASRVQFMLRSGGDAATVATRGYTGGAWQPWRVITGLGTNTRITVAGATYTLDDKDTELVFNTSGACVLTLPDTQGLPRLIYVSNRNNQLITSASSNITKLSGATTNVVLPAVAGSWAILRSVGTAWHIVASSGHEKAHPSERPYELTELFHSATPVSHTGAVALSVRTVALPADPMGPNGELHFRFNVHIPDPAHRNTENKTVRVLLGGTPVMFHANDSLDSDAGTTYHGVIYARGLAAQFFRPASADSPVGQTTSAAATTSTVNMAVAQNLEIELGVENSAHVINLETFTVHAIYRP